MKNKSLFTISFLLISSLIISFVITGCSHELQEESEIKPHPTEISNENNDVGKTKKEANTTSTEKHETTISSNLVDIQTIDPTIQVDLKYASDDNFMKQKLYFKIDKLYVQHDVAERLAKCQQYLQKLHPNYSLLIYDGARPVAVQQRMWDALDTIPVAERGKFVSNPKNHSVHNYGAAVDLTIVDEKGIPLDMGAGYDDIRKIAYPSLEAQFLASGELTQKQVNNRKLLRKVMNSQGFINIPSEWWHFNAYPREEVKRRYEVILEE